MYLVNYLPFAHSTVASDRYRIGQQLLGVRDGVNVTYTVPLGDKFTHNLPFFSIHVYYNGVRLTLMDDYTIHESGGFGTGYDTVMLEFAPISRDHLLVDYVAVGAP